MGCTSFFRSKLPKIAASVAKRRPAVGVGVVIFRDLIEHDGPEVLLIRRGKPPSKGLISFPGGSQELGETVIECAIREAREECGCHLRHDPGRLRVVTRKGQNRVPQAFLRSSELDHPTPFTAVDVIAVNEDDADERDVDAISYHYAIVEVAATVDDPRRPPVASDDADDAFWWKCRDLIHSEDPDIVPNLKHVVEIALETFTIPKQ